MQVSVRHCLWLALGYLLGRSYKAIHSWWLPLLYLGALWEGPSNLLRPVSTSTKPGTIQQKVQGTPEYPSDCRLPFRLSN